MRIAVVGAGISGLHATRLVARHHEVVLFEAAPRLGGHTHTVTVREGDRHVPVDTGFIVFNARTYPRFCALLGELGIAHAPSDMSFSVRSERRDLEYASTSLYSQRRRLLDPRHHRMVLDILRFFRDGKNLLADGAELPLADWLTSRGYSDSFSRDHLLPLVRAIWSTNRETALRFPARFLARFFDNHGFLEAGERLPWLTIPGGARTYVDALRAALPAHVSVRTGAPVDRVVRVQHAVMLRVGGAFERFDQVIMACHADQALALLDAPTPTERAVLGAIPYQKNVAVLHTDQGLMPRHRRTWASWNVHLDDDGQDGACITYWMNRLQPLAAHRQYFVTLNHEAAIDPAHVLGRFEYHHPVFTPAGVAAQARHGELMGARRTFYCGAYWGNGFHEDGVVSAERVADALLDERRLARAA
jgi:predicted NAD/FAD-binding protein